MIKSCLATFVLNVLRAESKINPSDLFFHAGYFNLIISVNMKIKYVLRGPPSHLKSCPKKESIRIHCNTKQPNVRQSGIHHSLSRQKPPAPATAGPTVPSQPPVSASALPFLKATLKL